MDYGRLAYLKAEELERYINRREATEEKRSALSATFYPRTAAESGYAPCSVSASGNVGLTVAVAVSAPIGANEIKLRLYVGDKLAAYTVVNLAAGERGRYTLLASAYPTGSEKIKLVASATGLIIDEMQVLAEGGGVSLSVGQDGYKCDYLGDKVYMAREENGDVAVKIFGTDTSCAALHGSTFDLCAFGGGVAVLGVDDNGNLWGVSYDSGLTETGRKFLGSGADKVALGRSAAGFALAAVRGGKIYFAECDEDFSGMTDWSPSEFEAEADDVWLSKQTSNPALFFSRGGKLYAKIAMPSFGLTYDLNVRATLTVGSGT